MSYQVLARKWRPQTFHELVGQSHVKQALVNALTQNRLHHAYLFTGTRGVGKTTIARIFAKSLNCDEGISATPCGQCSSCVDIEAGRYIDLLEIDAASRTKVEDTREILDNVQYAPTRGRYKVYLIDEVHMLSKHSFNALLKTLEEPPEHVKFLLATTDPQKLPVTILSRCLQFNLNALSQSEIKTQLQHVLTQEQISFENDALSIIAKSADGSMRDALSLTDQAIAQTNGDINNQAVKAMLGLMDTHFSQSLFAALLEHDGRQLINEIAHIASRNPNYIALLDDLIALMHLTQLTQLVPQSAQLDEKNADYIKHVAEHTNAQQIQIYYQLLINGKKDLQWAPDPRLGFEMLMLRLLAFEPVDTPQQPIVLQNEKGASNNERRTDALRDILSKTKPVDTDLPPKNEKSSALQPPQPFDRQSEVSINHTESTEDSVANSNVRLADTSLEQQATQVNIQTPSHLTDDSHSTTANYDEAIDDAHISSEEHALAAQFDDVMSSALEQGFNPYNEVSQNEQHDYWLQTSDSQTHVKHEHSSNEPEQTQSNSIADKEAQAQSAIARILRDRNISGSGKLAGAHISSSPDKKANHSAQPSPDKDSPVNTTEQSYGQLANSYENTVDSIQPTPVSQDTLPPWNTQSEGEHEKKHELPSAGSNKDAKRINSPKSSRLDFQKKHQTITENLAPELLEQINPQSVPVAPPQGPSIPVPEDFQSPISEIKFAHQQDEWAYLIKRMGLGGRMRQFALHSIFTKQGNNLHIDVDESQKHLDTPVLRQKLDSALSSIYDHNVSLSINFAKGVIDSPYLIQQKIDAGRHQQAIDVIATDENIVQFQQLFSAEIDENSIQAL